MTCRYKVCTCSTYIHMGSISTSESKCRMPTVYIPHVLSLQLLNSGSDDSEDINGKANMQKHAYGKSVKQIPQTSTAPAQKTIKKQGNQLLQIIIHSCLIVNSIMSMHIHVLLSHWLGQWWRRSCRIIFLHLHNSSFSTGQLVTWHNVPDYWIPKRVLFGWFPKARPPEWA